MSPAMDSSEVVGRWNRYQARMNVPSTTATAVTTQANVAGALERRLRRVPRENSDTWVTSVPSVTTGSPPIASTLVMGDHRRSRGNNVVGTPGAKAATDRSSRAGGHAMGHDEGMSHEHKFRFAAQ